MIWQQWVAAALIFGCVVVFGVVAAASGYWWLLLIVPAALGVGGIHGKLSGPRGWSRRN